MKKVLIVFFSIVLVSMLVVTSWASLYENVLVGGAKIIAEPWGIATLFDTYFAFFTFYFWLAYKENHLLKNIVWLALVILLGNIAMAVYGLLEIRRLGKSFTTEKFLTERKA